MSPRLLILPALAVALAVALAATASALPCQTCEPSDPPDPPPVITTQRVSHTLTVQTERGRVTDGVALDCPGACTRTITYVRRCSDGDCPDYAYSVVALTLTPAAGYTATWDGCTPKPGAPATCEVLLDADKTVRVIWAENPSTGGGGGGGEPGTIAEEPLHGGGAVEDAPAADGDTSVSGTVETRAPAGRGKRGAIRSTLRYSFRRSATWTEFTRLTVRHIPHGATTSAACKGQGCPAGATVSKRAGRVDLTRYTGRRYGAGATLTVRVAKSGKEARTTRMVVRRGRDPRVTHP